MGGNEYSEVEVEVHFVTDAAIRVSLDGSDDGAVWIPLSQIDEDGEINKDSTKGEVGTLTVKTWVAEDRGLL